MTATDQRSARRAAILERLRQGPVPDQASLAAELAALGHAVNQATLSRDLRALGARKGPEGYLLPGAGGAPPSAGLARLRLALGQGLQGVQRSQQLLVLSTPPGLASALALALDHSGLAGLQGTLAGDDTVLAITPDPKTARALAARLEELRP